MAISDTINSIQTIEDILTTTPVPGIRQTDTQTNGRLKVEVYASEGAVPVSDATVKVLDGTKVIEELNVNESGEAGLLEISCPNVELSEEPQEIERPYKELSLSIEANGFETTNIAGIQIFGDTTAIQQVNLTPRVAPNNIIIPQHTLWGSYPTKIPESPVKELPDATGYQVLDKPVIPAYVVVHNAAPSAYGTNYWIPFKDYVKNVASSEIYATWPRETIKANILCIISFVLNRVYTEWYRGKGYNFTITNSTEYVKIWRNNNKI